MIKHRIFIGFILFEILVLVFLFLHGVVAKNNRSSEIRGKRMIVHDLMLTDLSIWTEARYTRNPSQADLFSPFQDYPSSIEHFPAGSIIAPAPASILRGEFK
ncbi:hypothetical protein BMS3Bbin06_01853 [bacterium BMS3Bbin06]|nr:hypothetical protein BMS3Abin08_00401 [bacterium BMS3Abin08]GBE35315.1 hypothetical protein BMS3Bbin06_01853 [bacterium BMS3Bbin06]HDO36516.1 hypothetical protein [Nitrospirota bacterium]HDY71193.1 hypothetical protein [Nitrospirota bacterium]